MKVRWQAFLESERAFWREDWQLCLQSHILIGGMLLGGAAIVAFLLELLFNPTFRHAFLRA